MCLEKYINVAARLLALSSQRYFNRKVYDSENICVFPDLNVNHSPILHDSYEKTSHSARFLNFLRS